MLTAGCANKPVQYQVEYPRDAIIDETSGVYADEEQISAVVSVAQITPEKSLATIQMTDGRELQENDILSVRQQNQITGIECFYVIPAVESGPQLKPDSRIAAKMEPRKKLSDETARELKHIIDELKTVQAKEN